MNDHDAPKSISELVGSYRSIKATPHLLTRVEAHASDTNDKALAWWLPACGAGLALVFVAVLLANQGPSDSSPMMEQAVPGFSRLASVSSNTRPVLPSSTQPSFSQLRSVERPTLPTKPVL